MAWSLWLVYALAALGLSLTPGPNGLLALTHGALYGTRRALSTVCGGVAGFTVLIALAMFGLGAVSGLIGQRTASVIYRAGGLLVIAMAIVMISGALTLAGLPGKVI